MIAKIEMQLNCDTVNYRNSSNLQGVIMENIDTGYADFLHQQGLNPYSQYVHKKEGKTNWCICTLDNESYEQIITRFMNSKFDGFAIKNNSEIIKIVKKSLVTRDESELMNQFYNESGQKYYDVEFITPTSFKSNGKYMIYPDLGMIYRSLMKKYSIVSEQNMYDEDTLEQLVNYSNITRYRLQSTLFPLEGVVIPSFKGNISVRIHGSDTMSRYARLLLSFGEYSGVGIKSSIGMGAIKLGRMEG